MPIESDERGTYPEEKPVADSQWETVTLSSTSDTSGAVDIDTNGLIKQVLVDTPYLKNSTDAIRVQLLDKDGRVVTKCESVDVEPGVNPTRVAPALGNGPWAVQKGMGLRIHIDTKQGADKDFNIKRRYV